MINVKVTKDYLKQVLEVNTCSYREEEMVAFLEEHIPSIAPEAKIETDKAGNILVTKGSLVEGQHYPCMAAHMDTVHDIYPNFKVVESRMDSDILYAVQNYGTDKVSKAGIGGDDKVGVYLALTMLQLFDTIKVAFFTNEEVGCIGSSNVDLKWFDDCSFVIQGDRRGNNEIIYEDSNGKCASDAFMTDCKPIATKFGYHFSDKGSLTDVTTMSSDGLEISVYNVACGYYKAHTEDEYVSISDVENCVNLVANIINDLGGAQYPHKNEYSSYRKNYYGSAWGASPYWDDFNGCWSDESPSNTGNHVVISGPVTQEERDKLARIHGDYMAELDDQDIISWFADDLKDIRCTKEEEEEDDLDDDISSKYKMVGKTLYYEDHRVYIPDNLKCPCGGNAEKTKDDIEFICQSCGNLIMDEYTIIDYLDAEDEKNKPKK
jgi:hypothetical protein